MGIKRANLWKLTSQSRSDPNFSALLIWKNPFSLKTSFQIILRPTHSSISYGRPQHQPLFQLTTVLWQGLSRTNKLVGPIIMCLMCPIQNFHFGTFSGESKPGSSKFVSDSNKRWQETRIENFLKSSHLWSALQFSTRISRQLSDCCP